MSCAFKGCKYNDYPVFSSLPCPSPPLLQPAAPPPPPPAYPPTDFPIPQSGVAVLDGNRADA
eukprot:CAMPEP_0119351008 /NCGR_PEP_ID=MMETSP1334-20130426/273_1 /TAXON_ID=127549 /ORGANISM="Calcidiscus leptoporus, Strain RCC1130" /LENGTH=61 /DNA_ID=CAMNT_0007363707 /DNA_START=5 /DNA_END=187 /DNA_ORIENTATION=+